MKKFFLLPLLLFSPLFALPIGNPMDASLYRNGLFWGDCCEDRCCDPCDPCFNWCEAWSLRVGFYGDYVFNRHMELRNGTEADIDDFELHTNAGLITLNICDRLDIFGTLGATNISLSSNANVFGVAAPTARVFLDTETRFSWSVGGRLAIWSCDCFYFGIEGQYFHTKPDVKLIEVAGLLLEYPDDEIELKYREWQVGIGASYFFQVGCSGMAAIPYVGVKWAGSKADLDDALVGEDLTLFDLENKKRWGWALGTTVLFCDALSLTLEGRWGDEKAVHVNGQFRF